MTVGEWALGLIAAYLIGTAVGYWFAAAGCA